MSKQGHQSHAAKAAVCFAVKIAQDAFFEKPRPHIGEPGAFILHMDEQPHTMRDKVVEADMQNGSQETRSNATPGILHDDAPEPDALIGSSHALQN